MSNLAQRWHLVRGCTHLDIGEKFLIVATFAKNASFTKKNLRGDAIAMYTQKQSIHGAILLMLPRTEQSTEDPVTVVILLRVLY